MPTTARGYPYVVGTDTVTSYPTTSLALANAIDSKLGGPVATGSYSIGSIATGATAAVVVTFPVGRFSAPPQIFLSAENSRLILSIANGFTAASFSMVAGNWSGASSPAGVTGYWMAFGKVP